MKLGAAVAIYFLIVFGSGFLVGPIRVLFVEPRVGSTSAVLIEAPILLAAMFVGVKYAVRWSGVARNGATLFAVGLVALMLQQVADVVVGIALRGMTIGDHFTQFATSAGMIYGALLIAFVVMPVVRGWNEREGRSPSSKKG